MTDKDTFVTSTGYELHLRPVSPLLMEKVGASVEMPQRPTYKAETVSGAVEEHPHDETTLETDEDKAAWQRYLMETALADRMISQRVTTFLFRRGIDWSKVKLPKDGSWIKEQALFGVKVPKDPLERKIHWVETEVLVTPDEIKLLIAKLTAKAGGISEEVLRAAERSFRHSVEGETAGGAEDTEGGVELQPELSPDEDDAGVGEDP